MIIESDQKTEIISFPIVLGLLFIGAIYIDKFSWKLLILVCILLLIKLIDLYVFTNRIEFLDMTLVITKRFLWIHKVKTIPFSNIRRVTLQYSFRNRGIDILLKDYSNYYIPIWTPVKELKNFGNYLEDAFPNTVYVNKLIKDKKLQKNEH